MAASSSAVKPAVGILSIGDMGLGIAKLLRAHDYPVFTVASGRSQHTIERIKAAQVTDLPSDEALVIECDIILSIVPPRDAGAIARRICEACKAASKERQDAKGLARLLFVDCNAISSRSTKAIGALFVSPSSTPSGPSIVRRLSRSLSSRPDSTSPPVPVTIRFLDGAIIGGPPHQNSDQTWKKPSFIMSGPEDYLFSNELQSILNVKIISDQIGAASTLKSCFAAFSKGLWALGIASYTTAHSAGILPELQSHLADFYPAVHGLVEKNIVAMPPKAYRWVDEMKHIGETFADEGDLAAGQSMFNGVSDLYKVVADDTVLGKEITGKRKRGTTVEDVAEAVHAGIEEKKLKGKGEEKLELAWRGSWT